MSWSIGDTYAIPIGTSVAAVAAVRSAANATATADEQPDVISGMRGNQLRIAIDPNVRTAGNQTYSGVEDLFGDVDELHVGDPITVMCLETDVIGDATVAKIDLDSKRRLIYLDVDWQSLRPENNLT